MSENHEQGHGKNYESIPRENRYDVPAINGNLLEEILYQGFVNAREKIQFLEEKICERQKLKYRIISDLDHEWGRAQDLISRCEGSVPYNHTPDPKIGSLRKLVADIEREKIREEVQHWKDITFLEKELNHAREEYAREKGKLKALREDKQ